MAELEKRGQCAHALDLPGCGADQTPRREITLESWRRALVAFVEARNLRNLVLVGHSLAGLVLAAAAPDLADRIERLDFVAALLPEQGQRVLDLLPPERRLLFQNMVDASSDFSYKTPYKLARQLFFEELSEEQARSYYQKLTPQPFQIWLDRLQAEHFCAAQFCRRYIICRFDRLFSQEMYQAFAARLEVKPLYADCGHDIMLSHPALLADLLITAD